MDQVGKTKPQGQIIGVEGKESLPTNTQSQNRVDFKEVIIQAGKRSANFVIRKYNERKEKIAQNLANQKRSAINESYKAIELNKHAMHPSLFTDIDNFYSRNNDNLAVLSAYFLTEETRSFISVLKSFKEDIARDEASYTGTHSFLTHVQVLFDALGREKINNKLQAIAKSYHVKASGNVMLTSVLAAQNRNGMALLSAAEGMSNSYKAGAHNSEMNTIMCELMECIGVSQPAANVNDAHTFYLRAASRLVALHKHEHVSKRAYFSLIFNNGNCKVLFPDASSEAKNIAWSEFNNHFAQYVWSPSEAAAHIDELKNKETRVKELIELKEIKTYINKYYFIEKQRQNMDNALTKN